MECYFQGCEFIVLKIAVIRYNTSLNIAKYALKISN